METKPNNAKNNKKHTYTVVRGKVENSGGHRAWTRNPSKIKNVNHK